MSLRLYDSCTLLGTFFCLLLLLTRHHAYPLRTRSPRQCGASYRQNLRTAAMSTATENDGSQQTPAAGTTISLLDQLQRQTTVWADTADLATVERLACAGVNDATTNPSIIAATTRRSAGPSGKSPFQVTSAHELVTLSGCIIQEQSGSHRSAHPLVRGPGLVR